MKDVTTNKSFNGSAEPSFSIWEGNLLSIPGPSIIELLSAVLDKGASFRFQARGFSMSPFIRDGDIITLSPLTGVSPHLGDVVAFVRPGTESLVVHRVVGKKNQAFLIMGDRSREPDGLISQTSLLGRVIKVERNGKEISIGIGPERILIAFLTRTGLLLRLMLPAWRYFKLIVKRSAHERI